MQIKFIHIVLLALLMGNAVSGYAQEWSPFTLQDKPGIRIGQNINFQTNTLPANFVKEVWQSNHLTHQIKTAALNNLQTLDNLAKLENKTTLQFTHPLKDSSFIFSTRITNQQFGEMSFSKTTFQLAFFGNSTSIGQKVPLDFHYRDMALQTMQLGLHYKGKKHIAGIELGPVSGSYMFDFELNDGYIYTQEDLSGIEAGGEAIATWSDSTGKRDLWSGTGISAAIYYGYKSKDHQFYIMLDDFGLINFQNNDISDQTDSTWNYSGVNYNIFEQDEVIFNINQDSVQQWTNLKKAGNKRYMLPSALRFGLKQQFENRKFFLNILGKYHLYSFARPELKIIPGWTLNQTWEIMASMSHGGYSSLNAGLHIKSKFENGWHLAIGSNNLAGMWFNNHPAAMDVYLTICKY
ncbi:MAG: hypothetical protein K9J21_02380 [Bacteroidales bacterium]|nr:hypothetical protein [Bacteroidales bacterium]